MSETPSKRERQKQRREVKLAEQRAAAAKARRNRLLIIGALVLIFLGLVAAAVMRQRAESARLAAQEQEAIAQLDELGCTPDEEQDDLGGGHLESTALAAAPPEDLYEQTGRPASSGQHFGSVFKTGVYDQLLDERILVHNLEHGYINAYYTEDAPEDEVTALKEFAQEQIDGPYKKLIVSPWDGEMAEPEANFAFTAWHFRQLCESFDTGVYEVFIRKHHSGAGRAPERTVGAHLEAGGGVIDPGEESYLLPPLGEQAAPEEQMTEDGEDGATEDSS